MSYFEENRVTSTADLDSEIRKRTAWINAAIDELRKLMIIANANGNSKHRLTIHKHHVMI